MTWLCMKYEAILLSASMFSERCTMLYSLDEKFDRQKKVRVPWVEKGFNVMFENNSRDHFPFSLEELV